jgi:uncharacterized protein (TIGR02246 family)
VLAVAVLCAGLPCAQASGQTADAVAAALNQRYVSAVTQKDLAELMDLHDGDAFVVDETNSNVMPASRAEMEETFRAFIAGVKSFSLTMRAKRSAFLKPDVVLSEGEWEGAGRTNDDQAMPPMKGVYVLTLVKRPGGWKIAALGSFVLQAPAQ